MPSDWAALGAGGKLSTLSLRLPEITTYHKKPYPSISPLRPELSQAGKTVLVAGGSTGIGFYIARAFVRAKAARVIITGRRESVLKDSVAKLLAERTDESTIVSSVILDAFDLSSTAKLWASLKADNIFVDVLVINAASAGKVAPILKAGFESVWWGFETNVRTLLDFATHFHLQDPEGKRQKWLVNVSTSAIHKFEVESPVVPTYGLTKNAGTLVLQQIAKDTDPSDIQIVSFHPGALYTELAASAGVPAELYDWDDDDLPAGFAVWAASPEARFLHGRFAAAHWDVDELKRTAERVKSDPHFLKIGVVGIN